MHSTKVSQVGSLAGQARMIQLDSHLVFFVFWFLSLRVCVLFVCLLACFEIWTIVISEPRPLFYSKEDKLITEHDGTIANFFQVPILIC